MNDGMPQLKLTRSSHNLSNTTCFDVEQGWLVPTAVYDCVPGDRFNLGSQALIRTTALVKPAFTVNLQAKSASFFVAYRTIWKAFEDFFSGGRSGNAKIPLPVFNINDELLQYSIFDYFGLPCVSSNPVNTKNPDTTEYINALYLLAYLKIWNDYFRNPSLDIEIDVLNLTIYKPNDDTAYDFSRHTTPFSFIHNGISYIGASVTIFLRWCFGLISNTFSLSNLTLDVINSNSPNPPEWQKRKYSRPALVNLPRDLFTSALPTASSSNPVSLGVTGNISITSVSGIGNSHLKHSLSEPLSGLGLTTKKDTVGLSTLNKGTLNLKIVNGDYVVVGSPSTDDMKSSLYISNRDIARGLSIETSGGFSSGIYPRELRLVFGLDLKQQIRNLSGNRYQDLLKAFYGVTTRDYRLNLAEYIGGSRYPIYTSEVLQTSETSNTPLGDQAGHAIGSGNSSHGSYFVEELGCILNLFWINSENVYAQELRRDWRKFSINDYFFPMFEKLGDQELLQEEICYTIKPKATLSMSNSRIFGFVPRYSEYKFYNNTVKGGFRGNYRYWSQARFFRSDSNEVMLYLNSSFIKPNTATFNRIFQTIDSDYTLKPYQVKFVNNTIAFRPMEENTIGYLIDHF